MSADDLTALGGRRVLITGADGMLGRAFTEALQEGTVRTEVLACTHPQLDVTNRGLVLQMSRHAPDIILHCAGLVDAERCERDRNLAHRVLVEGTRHVVELAEATSAQVLFPQSILIYDGTELPVTEQTPATPTSEYGRLKVLAEKVVAASATRPLIIRMAGFFGGDDKDKNFVGTFTRRMLRMVESGDRSIDVGDRIWQPTYTLDLARNAILLLARGCVGTYQMGSIGEAAFYDVASVCVAELDAGRRIAVRPCSSERFDAAEAARRPPRMVVSNAKLEAEGLCRQRPWRDALHEYLQRPYFDRFRNAFQD